MSFSGDGSEQSLRYLCVMPDVCRMDGEVAASHLHLDGIHSPSPSHFLSVYPFSFYDLAHSTNSSTLACSVVFRINHLFHVYCYKTMSRNSIFVPAFWILPFTLWVRVNVPLVLYDAWPCLWTSLCSQTIIYCRAHWREALNQGSILATYICTYMVGHTQECHLECRYIHVPYPGP